MASFLKAGNFPNTLVTVQAPTFPLSGLRAWYDANVDVFKNSTGTILCEQCAPVYLWKDQSGNDNHLAQTVSTKQPAYKKYHRLYKSFISFDGTDDTLESQTIFQQTLSGDCTAFIVYKSSPDQPGLGTNRLLSLELDNTNTNRLWVGHGSEEPGSTSQNNLHIGIGNSTIVQSVSTVADDNINLLTIVRTGSADGTIKAYLNNELLIDDVWTAAASVNIQPAQFKLGGDTVNGFLQGDIGEVMIYGSVLSEQQRLNVQRHLLNKWQIGTVDPFVFESPASYSNLVLWLDANVGTYDMVTGGNASAEGIAVARWEDQSGNNHHATQSTGTQMPLLTDASNCPEFPLLGLAFDGANDYLQGSHLGTNIFKDALTYYFVGSLREPLTTSAQGQSLFGGVTTSANVDAYFFLHLYKIDASLRSGIYANNIQAPYPNTLATFSNNPTPVWIASLAASPYCGAVNSFNGQVKNQSALTSGFWSILNPNPILETPIFGARNVNSGIQEFAKCTIHEVLIYNKFHDVEERQNIETYLLNKWNDPDVANYIAAVEAADGVYLEQSVKDAYRCFILGCKKDGIWDDIKASCIMAGARTLEGCLVPLVGPAPTNYNFTFSDYNRKTGLKADGVNKYLNSNKTLLPGHENDAHASVWVTEQSMNKGYYLGGKVNANGSTYIFDYNTRTRMAIQDYLSTNDSVFASGSGFKGVTRGTSNSYTGRSGNVTYFKDNFDSNITASYQSISLFAGDSGSGPSEARLSFYSIGSDVDLEKLDNRVTQLMTDLQNATLDNDDRNYITAVETADQLSLGDPTIKLEEDLKVLYQKFILGCKNDGLWEHIKTGCIMAGALTLSGALVPLSGSNGPTPYGFVDEDYNSNWSPLGIKGDGSTKYLDSNRANDADPQDSKHMFCYLTETLTRYGNASPMGRTGTNGSVVVQGPSGATYFSNNSELNARYPNGTHYPLGGWGTSRSNSASFEYIFKNTGAVADTGTITLTSGTPFNGNIGVFGNTGYTYTDARIPFYSIGESINLEALNNRVKTLFDGLVDPDVYAYIQNVEAADGVFLENSVKQAYYKFIRGCKKDGIWDSIKASCIMAGARTLEGALVPLAGPAPTKVGFTFSDYDRKTGLIGDGTGKYLNTNYLEITENQNNKHISALVTQVPTTTARGSILGGQSYSDGSSFLYDPKNGWVYAGISANTKGQVHAGNLTPSLFGVSRNINNSANYITRRNGVSLTASLASQAFPNSSATYKVFAASHWVPTLTSDARISFYSIGESIDLAKLDARVATLMNDLALAIP